MLNETRIFMKFITNTISIPINVRYELVINLVRYTTTNKSSVIKCKYSRNYLDLFKFKH